VAIDQGNRVESAHRTVDLGDRRTIGQLITDLVDDVRSLIKDQIALAKAEVRSSVKAVAVGVIGFAVAAVFATIALIMLLLAGVHGLNEAGFAMWTSYLIVGGALLLIALIAAGIAASRIKKAQAPAHTKVALERNVEALHPDH
jgi:hypothetical protein